MFIRCYMIFWRILLFLKIEWNPGTCTQCPLISINPGGVWRHHTAQIRHASLQQPLNGEIYRWKRAYQTYTTGGPQRCFCWTDSGSWYRAYREDTIGSEMCAFLLNIPPQFIIFFYWNMNATIIISDVFEVDILYQICRNK